MRPQNFKNRHYQWLVILLAIFSGTFFGCSKTSFTPVDKPSDIDPLGPPVDPINSVTYENKSTKFDITDKKQQVDILFVVDNSISMEEEQDKISKEFSGFIFQISKIDWRIAITTMDNDNTGEGNKGSFVNFKKNSGKLYFIDSKTQDANNLFSSSVRTGTSGSNSETGLFSVREFIKLSNNSKKVESQFLRPTADFHTIVVSDSDQDQDSSSNSYDIKELFKVVKGKIKTKNFVNHSFVNDGTFKCTGEVEAIGASYIALSQLTKGTVGSICKPNYATNFKLIADSINSEVVTKNLDCVPADTDNDGRPNIQVISPSLQIIKEFNLKGSQLTFSKPLVEFGSYEIKYLCPKK